jgi:hypothetical protein
MYRYLRNPVKQILQLCDFQDEGCLIQVIGDQQIVRQPEPTGLRSKKRTGL